MFFSSFKNPQHHPDEEREKQDKGNNRIDFYTGNFRHMVFDKLQHNYFAAVG
ncbi:MAG: hypothetical protein MUE33_09490 [Cytophagaceae bacterium]|jgi:hypothetical protein|nr:hypothetical protein [Cytophagaceae bacterium]